MAWSLFSQQSVNPKSWADAELTAGHWPETKPNEQSLIAWALLEGGGGDFNPLNTSLQESGSTNFNGSAVQNYTDWQEGVKATVTTIQTGYPGIEKDLASGSGISATPELRKWSTGSLTGTGGYDSLSGTWTRAAGYLKGKSAPLPAGSTQAQLTGFSITDPVSWLKSILGIFGAASDLKDWLQRFGLIIFGAVILIVGLVMISKTQRDNVRNIITGQTPTATGKISSSEGEAGEAEAATGEAGLAESAPIAAVPV